jgi:hypothetical protein
MEFHKNSDGSVICVLSTPVKFKGEEHERVTVPALKGKHLKVVSADDTSATIASKVVEPVGIYDELVIADAVEVNGAFMEAWDKALGKSGASKVGG